jgi:hypothetical protein
MKAVIAGLFLMIVSMACGQSPAEHHCSMMKPDDSPMKHDEMVKHGEMAMGFSQVKTTHHFRLSPAGGSIEVQANDASDTVSRDQIRHHLQEIAKSFAAGDFSSPMLTHGRMLPGVPDLQRLKSSLAYSYVETERGAKVLINTANAEALKVVQEFLRFQIQEHETGDSETVEK